MIKALRAFLADETAVTAIEYALIAGGLSIVIVIGVQSVGTTLNGIFGNISTQLASGG
jgi:pilus assembly protein Flp/PilA